MDKQTAKECCFRYFEGTADYRTEQVVREFLQSDAANLEEFRSWEKEWSRDYTPTILQIDSFNKLRSRIKYRRIRRLGLWCTSVAAVLAVLFGIFSLNTDSVEISEPRLYVVETGYQERTKVVLPDSTQVWLNAASRLAYTDDFMVNNREVEIAGEAFFDVTRNEELPFVVRFAGNTITVKGTRFNVTAYDVEDKVYAALVEGCIEFAGNTVKLDMNPGELLSYDTNSEDVVKCKADLSSHVSWVGGKLDYSAITLDQLLTRLSSIYGFKVKYDPVKYVNHTFRIILSTNESLNDVLDAVSIIVPFDWKYEDGIVTVIEK